MTRIDQVAMVEQIEAAASQIEALVEVLETTLKAVDHLGRVVALLDARVIALENPPPPEPMQFGLGPA
tara:strand:- start:283 stop:486 length:204 start_codon:yes stop_codon:yes gene_type:complete